MTEDRAYQVMVDLEQTGTKKVFVPAAGIADYIVELEMMTGKKIEFKNIEAEGPDVWELTISPE